MVESPARIRDGLPDDSLRTENGHPRMGRDQPSQRPELVAYLGIRSQHTLRSHIQASAERPADAARGGGRFLHPGSLSEPERIRPADRGPLVPDIYALLNVSHINPSKAKYGY